MNLVKYDNSNIRAERISKQSTHCRMSINLKTGIIRFTVKLVELLGAATNKLAIVQDSDRPQDWYIQVDNSEQGIPVRQTKNAGCVIQSSKLSKIIAESCGLDLAGGVYTFQVSDTPDDNGLYAIITKSAK